MGQDVARRRSEVEVVSGWASPRSGLPPEVYEELDRAVLAGIRGQARLDAAAAVGVRGLHNVEQRLAPVAGRAVQEYPALTGEVRQVVARYVSLTEVAMVEAAFGR